MWRIAGVLVFVAACSLYFGTDDVDRTMPPPPPDSHPRLDQCSPCATGTDCETGICRLYGDGVSKCSLTCTVGEAAPQCESGGCNGMGYCMCAPYQPPPADACVGCDAAEIPIDATMDGM